MRKAAPAVALLCLLVPWPRPVAAEPSLPSRTLSLLHDGRFDAADRLLASTLTEDPSERFLRAFVTYWRLLYDAENPSLRAELERRLLGVLEVTDRRIDANPGDGRASLWAGTTRLFLAQHRAAEDQPFAAAREAKRARKLLEAAAAAGAESEETLFGLGTYDYAADRLPSILKGLRAILFLPGGNRERGIERLERSARESRYFSLESRIVLATLLSKRHERLFDRCLEETRLALEEHPDAVAALDAAARLRVRLDLPDEAADLLDRALARAKTLGDVDPTVVATLELWRARADLARLRPDLARERASAIAERGASLPEEIARDARWVVGEADLWVRSADWDGVRERLAGPLPPDAPPEGRVDPRAALVAGRALLRAGRPAGASAWLAVARSTDGLPDAWRGPAYLWAGEAADLEGKRAAALALYRKAADQPSFLARDAAFWRQITPYRNPS